MGSFTVYIFIDSKCRIKVVSFRFFPSYLLSTLNGRVLSKFSNLDGKSIKIICVEKEDIIIKRREKFTKPLHLFE